VTGIEMVVAPEFPSSAEASPMEMAGFVMRRSRPLTHVKPRARYFELCAARHFPPTWTQTTRPSIRSETPFVQRFPASGCAGKDTCGPITVLTAAVELGFAVAAGAAASSTSSPTALTTTRGSFI
jgi:hypothetical protein